MRTRLWNNLSNIKFKALYTHEWSKIATCLGNNYSLFLSLTSSGCVAAWAIWQEHPKVWAIIVAAAQLLHIAKPYIPLIKNDKNLLEMSFCFETLYLQYERLFYELDFGRIETEEAERTFYELRDKENEIEKMHKDTQCPNMSWIKNRVQQDTYTALSLNFQSEDISDEQQRQE